MRYYLFLPSLILCGVLLYMPSASIGAASDSGDAAASVTIPESQNELIKLTDAGIEPQTLTMKKEDSITFFLNETKESLVTVEIDFRGHSTHCASGSMQIGDDGVVRSMRPLGTNDFVSTCFHEAGTYAFTVYGLPKNPSGVKGAIIVE